MEKKYFTITIHRQETPEEQRRREAAERRTNRLWCAAAILILLLLALCWRAVEARGAREAEKAGEPTIGPVVQTLQLDLGISEPAEAAAVRAESAAPDRGRPHGVGDPGTARRHLRRGPGCDSSGERRHGGLRRRCDPYLPCGGYRRGGPGKPCGSVRPLSPGGGSPGRHVRHGSLEGSAINPPDEGLLGTGRNVPHNGAPTANQQSVRGGERKKERSRAELLP